MDPNATLRGIRELVKDYHHYGAVPEDELVERIEALDEWLSRGGFPPDEWRHEK